MSVSVKLIGPVLAAGWLAQALASTHPDVDAAVAAHAQGEFESALQSIEAARSDLGERPELDFDLGSILMATPWGDAEKAEQLERARKSFERGTESPHATVASSSHFELGNLAFDAGDWQSAIDHYISCLKLQPEHSDAKWNLELAWEEKRKEDEEKEDEEKEDEEDQDDEGESGEDETGGEEESGEDETGGEETETGESDGGEDETGTGEEESGGESGEGEGEEEESGAEGESGGDEKGEDDEPGEDDPAQEDEAENQGSPEDQNQPPPQQINRADIGRALEQLDAEDEFMMGAPTGRKVPVKKDW